MIMCFVINFSVPPNMDLTEEDSNEREHGKEHHDLINAYMWHIKSNFSTYHKAIYQTTFALLVGLEPTSDRLEGDSLIH